jgi:hypothetical protein
MSLRKHPQIPLPLRCRQLWNQYGRKWMYRHLNLIRKPDITCRIQKAGCNVEREDLTWRTGVCLRLPGHWCLIVTS